MARLNSGASERVWAQPSVVALILANLLPVGGVLFLGWEVFPLMLLFWLENVVVGVYAALKMVFAEPGDPSAWAAKVFMIPFFCFHYGIFCLVHGVFVFALFGGRAALGGPFPDPRAVVEAVTEWQLGWAVAALVASHGFSFGVNYLGRKEFQRAALPRLMGAPYGRIVILHVAILLGALLLMALGSPTFGLLILIAGKIALDLKAHLLERRRFGAEPVVPTIREEPV